MHQIIYALVEAPTREEALARGGTTFDRLLERTQRKRPSSITMSRSTTIARPSQGKARWGELPIVATVDSQTGAAPLERGWKATIQEFERNLERVRVGVEEFNTDELMHDKELMRHACHNLGAYRGPSLFLYTEFGTAIRHREQLDRVIEIDSQLWIIPADVHY